MLTFIVRIAGALITASLGNAFAAGLADHEKTCAELGFKKRTPAYGECVLELDRRATDAQTQIDRQASQQAQQRGDGTPDHQTCARFGFVVGTAAYSDCRLKIDIAKQDQAQRQAAFDSEQLRYEREKQRYDEQLAAQAAEKERQGYLGLMRFGLAMMGGTSPYASENVAAAARGSIGAAPVPPTRPQIQSFSITDRSGRRTNCTAIGNNINCF